ncbi:MAG: helix-turn-helix transcriptional regulator, partial [Lachnospiraceae bacterium]|nr:helix-turn-helix transcriptional regulator [Lachnospiraceae bacterium]
AIRFFDNYFYHYGEQKHNYLLFHSCGTPEIKDHILQIMSESLADNIPFRNEILKHYFELTVFYILRYSKIDPTSTARFSMKERYHLDLMNYLADNYRTATLESAAEQFHLSKNYISHIIHDISGETFISALNRIRTEKVKEYLLETNLTLDDIAELTGFSDSSYLWRIFKKLTGMSPSAYRKEHQHDYMG